jgi:hypothetical protein
MLSNTDVVSDIYTGDDANTDFDYPFKTTADSEIRVFVKDTSVTPNTVTEKTNFTVQANSHDNNSGGSITYPNDASDELTTTERMVIVLNLPLTQATTFTSRDKHTSIEAALDVLTKKVQVLDEQVARSIKLNILDQALITTDELAAEMDSPPTDEYFIQWNATSGRVEWTLTANTEVPLSELTQSGASTGNVVRWDGASWVPDGDLTTAEADIITNAAAIALNTTHRSSDGSDHSDVVLNTTHRSSDGSDHSDVVLNTTHRSSAGSDHSDVVLNTTHRSSAGSDHSDVVLNTTHRSSDGSDHSDVVLNTTHRSSDGSDHSDVVLNTTHRSSAGTDHSDVVLNTTHRSSDGSDHSDVVLNTTHRSSDGTDHSDVVLNTTHRSSDGSDHGFLDQAVTIAASPTFAAITSASGTITSDGATTETNHLFSHTTPAIDWVIGYDPTDTRYKISKGTSHSGGTTAVEFRDVDGSAKFYGYIDMADFAVRGMGGDRFNPAFVPSGTDGDTGIFSNSAGYVKFSSNSTEAFKISSSGTTCIFDFDCQAQIQGQAGSAVGDLAFNTSDDTDTGWYAIGANNLGIAAGGVLQVDINTARAAFKQQIRVVKQTRYDVLTTLSTTGAVSWDIQAEPVAKLDITDNVTLTINNIEQGSNACMHFIQHSTARTVTWPAAVKWAGGSAPDLSTVNAEYLISFFSPNGTDLIGSTILDYS